MVKGKLNFTLQNVKTKRNTNMNMNMIVGNNKNNNQVKPMLNLDSKKTTNSEHFKKKTIYYIYRKEVEVINTIKHYNDSFKKFSKFNFEYLDIFELVKLVKHNNILPINKCIIIFTYTVLHIYKEKILLNYFKNCNSIKIAFIQDDYYDINYISNFINYTNIHHIFTVLDKDDDIKKVYKSINFNNVKINKCLTGYINNNNNNSYKKIKDKKIDIFYRGKKLSPIYGELGYLKYKIGHEIYRYIKNNNIQLNINISSNQKDRIYGNLWEKILSNSKTTLATPSGSNVLNYDNILINRIKSKFNLKSGLILNENQDPNVIFKSVNEFNIKEELNLEVVSPKMFEAVQFGTVLIMYEGKYSNIFIANKHYIPLKRDHSNISEVINKIKDDNYLQKIADNAYNDIILSNKYTYQSFIKYVDHVIDKNYYNISKNLIK